MNQMQKQVEEFHKAFGVPVNQTPTIPEFERLVLRCKLILEEAIEFCDACGVDVRILDNHDKSARSNLCMSMIEFRKYAISQPNIEAMSDASTDLKYVTFGADLEFGFESQELFNEVQRSNMSKRWTRAERRSHYEPPLNFEFTGEHEDGPDDERCYIAKRTDGKIIKSPSYSPADIQSVLEKLKK